MRRVKSCFGRLVTRQLSKLLIIYTAPLFFRLSSINRMAMTALLLITQEMFICSLLTNSFSPTLLIRSAYYLTRKAAFAVLTYLIIVLQKDMCWTDIRWWPWVRLKVFLLLLLFPISGLCSNLTNRWGWNRVQYLQSPGGMVKPRIDKQIRTQFLLKL